MNYDYDFFVIGAGSGGVRAARMSASYGARVAIAEDLYLGGTCVNVGCVPKKLFVYAAHYSEDFHEARGFGWDSVSPAFNWKTLVENKNTEIKRLNGIYQNLLDNAGVTTINGRAVIDDPHTVVVGDTHYTAERILVATGGWPSVPVIPGKEHIISSNEAFYLDSLPDRIIVVGGGYIAVEFAGIFNGLGVETTLMYRGDLFLRGFDKDCRAFLKSEMQKKGVDLRFNTNIKSIVKQGDDFISQTTDDEELVSGQVMYATGRKPNISNIGLEQLDVKLNDRGAIIVNEDYQTSVPSVYAIGDVTDRYNLTPVAIAEGMALANSLYNNHPSKPDYEHIATCVFSQPNLATVGLTEEQALEANRDIDVYKSEFRHLKHTLSGSDERVFMKMLVEKQTDRVLGVHMVGPDAGEIIQGIAIALKAGATKQHFDTTIGIHPSAAEEFVTMREKASPG